MAIRIARAAIADVQQWVGRHLDRLYWRRFSPWCRRPRGLSHDSANLRPRKLFFEAVSLKPLTALAWAESIEGDPAYIWTLMVVRCCSLNSSRR